MIACLAVALVSNAVSAPAIIAQATSVLRPCSTVTDVSTRTVWRGSLAFLTVQITIAVVAIFVSERYILPDPRTLAWHVMPVVVALSQGPLLGYWVAFRGRWAPLRLLIVTCFVAGNAHLLTTYSLRVCNSQQPGLGPGSDQRDSQSFSPPERRT